MMKSIFAWFFVLVYCVYRTQGHICGSGQKFGVLKICQRTCGHKKPSVCLPRPRCYCEDNKIWDSKQKRCVFPYECIDRILDQHGTGFAGEEKIYGGKGGSNRGKSSGKGFLGGIVHRGGGTGGISSSVHGGESFSVSGFLKGILSLPIKIPADILKTIRTVIWNILSFNFNALRTSFNGVKGVAGYISGIFRSTFARIFDVFLKIGSVDADFVVGIINRVKGGTGWIVRKFASFNIDIIQLITNIAIMTRNRADSIVSSGIKGFAWVLGKAGDSFNGGLKILHIKQILQLPIIRTIASIITTIRKTGLRVVFEQLKEAEAFIVSIIGEHQDFFIPIFNNFLNLAYAIFSASHKIVVGGNAKDLSFHIGEAGFGIKSNGSWKITGPKGNKFGEGGPYPLKKNTPEGNKNSGFEYTGSGGFNSNYGGNWNSGRDSGPIKDSSGPSSSLEKYSGSRSGFKNSGGGGGVYDGDWNSGTNYGSKIFRINSSSGNNESNSGSKSSGSGSGHLNTSYGRNWSYTTNFGSHKDSPGLSSGSGKEKSSGPTGSKNSDSSSGSDNQKVLGSNYDLTPGGFNFRGGRFGKDSDQSKNKKQATNAKSKGKTSSQSGTGKEPDCENDSSEEKPNSKSKEAQGSDKFGFGEKSQGGGEGGGKGYIGFAAVFGSHKLNQSNSSSATFGSYGIGG